MEKISEIILDLVERAHKTVNYPFDENKVVGNMQA